MERKGFIGGSDAKRLLDGDWFNLWQEKCGLKEPEDLTHSFVVQLGVHTEAFHIQWLNKYHGFDIRPRIVEHHMDHRFLTASLDGVCRANNTFVEVKHTNARANRDSMVDWYQPQMAHYCNVTGKDHGFLSYIAGNSPPDFFKMQPSAAYRQALLEIELAFWWHVEQRVPPENLTSQADGLLDTLVLAGQDVKIDDMRVVDMTGNNEWASHATAYCDLKEAAGVFDRAKVALKKMVDADVRIAAGHGVMIKRSKTGSLLFSESSG